MSAPTTITESELKAYLHATLDSYISSFLVWTVAGGSYDYIVEDALIEYGAEDTDDIDSIEEVKLMRACGRYCMWKKVVAATVGLCDSTDSEISDKASQINAQARKAMADERSEMEDAKALVDGDSTGVRVYSVRRRDDPLTSTHSHWHHHHDDDDDD